MPETIPGYYIWEVPGKAVAVQLNLETVDKLSTVVMTGFGAIPRRGAEVGGILVGSIEGKIVRIDEFEPVACSYKRGPSYLLSDADSAAFAEAWDRWKPEPGKAQYAVGYYRSNTRDQATLSDEDRSLCERYFPPPSNIVLLIKPYATKVSTAGFITYEDGRLEDESSLEFPFRRFEIEGTAAPERRPLGERAEAAPRGESRISRREVESDEEQHFRSAVRPYSYQEPMAPEPEPEPERPYVVTAESRSARRRGWAWIPLSFIFLLLGVLLGFQAALTMYPNGSGPAVSASADPYSLHLTVTRNDDSLHIKWDREAAPIRTARRGLLYITDGAYTKQVELDGTQLQNGSVIYRRLSPAVRFRVEVYPRDRIAVAETVEWKE